jgi:hypothetical protein
MMKRTRRNRDQHDGTGPCDKYDAACAERTSRVLQWCEEELKEELDEEKQSCSEHPEPEKCKAEAEKQHRQAVLDCVGE